ncbi:hypothetical protein [Sphingomonas faeni]|uniref:hypothetical protein n=1 Tax=Sphingomonas faeni TaxID=185950 RepID=UPI00335A1EE9
MDDNPSPGAGQSTDYRELREELARLRFDVEEEKSRHLPVAASQPPGITAGTSIDERIATSGTPEEAAKWARVRGEIRRQDDVIADKNALRKAQLFSLRAKVGLSFAGVVVGAGVIAAGLPVGVGLFCLGVGLSPVAPELVANTFKQIFGKSSDE